MKKILFLTFCLSAIILFCFLGNWQLQRLAWKNAVLAELDAGCATHAGLERKLDIPALTDKMTCGRITGRFMNNDTLHLAPRTRAGKVGYETVTPFVTDKGDVIFVNRGWRAGPVADTADSYAYKTVSGLVRLPDTPSAFTPVRTHGSNTWQALRFEDMRAVLPDNLQGKLTPFVMYAFMPALAGTTPFALETMRPQSNHAYYATFWFIMAIVTAAMTFLFMRKK